MMATMSPLPTEALSETGISFTVPALSAFMLFSICDRVGDFADAGSSEGGMSWCEVLSGLVF